MTSFKIPPKQHDFTCTGCGQQSRGPEGSAKCSECRFYESHPEMAPAYFTWTKTGSGWAATAKWREKDPEPEPGAVITVHRKDGSTSEHTVAETTGHRYDTSGNLVLTCQVALKQT